MNTQYDLAIESFIMNFDGSIMNDMIAEEGLKDAMIKVKNAILAAIRWIVDKCKSLWRKITGKDKGEVGKIMKEAEKMEKMASKTDNPKLLQQIQNKVKEQKEKLQKLINKIKPVQKANSKADDRIVEDNISKEDAEKFLEITELLYQLQNIC